MSSLTPAAASLQTGKDSRRVDQLRRATCLAFLGLSWPAFRTRAGSNMPAAEKWWDESTTAVVTGGIFRPAPFFTIQKGVVSSAHGLKV